MVYVFALIPSAGVFQAVPAYLPSSFAMSFVTLGTASFLQPYPSVGNALTSYAIAGLLGWPFSLALVIPHLLGWAVESAVNNGVVSVMVGLFMASPGPIAVLVRITSLKCASMPLGLFSP